MNKFDYSKTDYIEVSQRIVDFRERFPEGSLQPADPSTPYRIEKIGDDTYIVVVAAAYRGPNDARPGVGMAYEVYPGKTPYTKGSELQNAETSAWGRAIVAALAADTKRGIASAEEVRNRQAEREQPRQGDPGRLETVHKLIQAASKKEDLEDIGSKVEKNPALFTSEQIVQISSWIEDAQKRVSGKPTFKGYHEQRLAGTEAPVKSTNPTQVNQL